MTVHISEGNAKVPLWAVICLIVTILLAAVGWVALATDKANESEHKAISDRVSVVEQATKAIPDMQKDIAVIAAVLKIKIPSESRK
jgi:hypothetical protein